MAYILVSGLRRLELKAMELAEAHPHEVVEDPGDGAESLGFDGIQLSLAEPLPTGLDEPALLKRHAPSRHSQQATSRMTPARISAAPLSITARSCRRRARIDPPHKPKTTDNFHRTIRLDRIHPVRRRL
jgi:hypothetical protein